MIFNVRKYQILKPALLLVGCLVIIGSVAGLATVAAAAGGWAEGVQWLLGQQVPNSTVPNPPPDRSGLVISYIVPPSDPSYPYLFSRSWIYDDALAVISWSMEGECQAAEKTLSALAGLLDADGKLGFSYNTHDDWFHELYRTGAIAWVGYSFVFYQKACGDNQFQSAAERIADWILTMQDPATGSVKGGPDVDWFSTEHNIDAYFFLRDFGLLTRNSFYLKAADQIKQSLLSNHWNPSYGCFQQGIGDNEKVLDAASWGALFLLRIRQSDKADSCLDFIEDNFPTTVTCDIGGVSKNISGYRPDVSTNLVWSEGSLGVAMAYQRVGDQAKHDEIVSEIWKMQGPNGGIVYACPPATDFANWESVAGTAWMIILQSDQQVAFWEVEEAATPILELTKQADPAPVQDGAPLTYTIRVTNTGNVTLTATITDTLPKHVTPTGILTWTPTITAPGGIWAQQVVVTVETGYTGSLTNKVQVTTEESAMGTASVTVCANYCIIYLPLVLKNYPPPWITVTASGSQASGHVGPSSFCNANYKVALYAKTDIWYVQPYDDWRRDVQINPNCTWESETHPWDQMAAHLVPASYSHPSTIRRSYCPPPPLDPATNPNVLAASCYPNTYPKTVVSAPGEKALVCVDCTESAARHSLIERSVIVGEEAIAAQVDGTYRGLWIWNTDVVTDTGAQHEFFTFAQLKNVSGAYLYVYDLLPNSSSELGDFIAGVDDIGVEVELLAGEPTWALTPTHPVALGFVQQAITFTQSITGGARPIGIHLDVEPYLLPEWNSDRSSTITQYLNLLSDVKQELAASGTSLTFTVDIPFWYDTIMATYKSATQPLNQHVQDITDRIVIMDYRDFAEGNDGIIHHAQDEMDYAQSIAKEVVIGIETNDVEPEKVTFFEEGETVMESELALVEQHYQASSAFRGFAIHDYSGYRTLAPIRSVHLPLVLKSHPAG